MRLAPPVSPAAAPRRPEGPETWPFGRRVSHLSGRGVRSRRWARGSAGPRRRPHRRLRRSWGSHVLNRSRRRYLVGVLGLGAAAALLAPCRPRPGPRRPGLGEPGPRQPGPRQPGPRQPGPRQPGPRQPGPRLRPGPRRPGTGGSPAGRRRAAGVRAVPVPLDWKPPARSHDLARRRPAPRLRPGAPDRLPVRQPGRSRRLGGGRGREPRRRAGRPHGRPVRRRRRDPRGSGRSAPVSCFATPAERAAFWGDTLVPSTRAEERAYLAKTVELARRCGRRNGDLLAHIRWPTRSATSTTCAGWPATAGSPSSASPTAP